MLMPSPCPRLFATEKGGYGVCGSRFCGIFPALAVYIIQYHYRFGRCGKGQKPAKSLNLQYKSKLKLIAIINGDAIRGYH